MEIHWIWFAELKISDRLKHELIEAYLTAEAVYKESVFALRAPSMDAKAQRILSEKSLASAQVIQEECENLHIAVLTYEDKEYPNKLRNISNPPYVLYCKGQLPKVDEEVTVALVGTRKPSPYGLTIAKKLGYQVASGGGIVVSGMALGVDSAAMDGALLAGKSVIGVLGTGADVCYPKSSYKIYEQTIRQGCILSEYPPHSGVEKQNFPRRNRIISGLSCGTVVIEGPERSGSLITAKYAREQGRDVFVVPGNVDMPGFVGSNRLLRDGAIPVGCGWDILSEYEYLYGDKLSQALSHSTPALEPEPPKSNDAKTIKAAPEKAPAKKIIDKPSPKAYIDPADLGKKLSLDEQKIAQSLRTGPLIVDEIIASTGISAAKMLALLTMLEIKGVITRLPGRQISLKRKE